MLTPKQAKCTLKKKGWSYRSAAPRLGVHFQSLSRILNGTYKNRRVLREIGGLPLRQEAGR
jgi:lambda repressor-like predicted transcriptional regulator